jgi:hypothetical protein
MKIKCPYFIISIFITLFLFIFIFLLNSNDPKSGIGIYFKLELIKYIAVVTGITSILIAVGSRVLKTSSYTSNFFYILCGVVNTAFGLYGFFYFSLHPDSLKVLHEFLLNFLIGVIIISDAFVTK